MLQKQNITNINIIATYNHMVEKVLQKRIVEGDAVYTICPSEVSMYTILTYIQYIIHVYIIITVYDTYIIAILLYMFRMVRIRNRDEYSVWFVYDKRIYRPTLPLSREEQIVFLNDIRNGVYDRSK